MLIDTDIDYSNILTNISVLGECKILNPIPGERNFVPDNSKVLINIDPEVLSQEIKENKTPKAFEMAGPREKIYFDPKKLKCAVVTCGGLCPGLNGVIRSVVLELHHRYGVKNIYGIKYGLQGFISKYNLDFLDLTPQSVADIIRKGGSFLGSSRGHQDIGEIVDCLERSNISVLFMIGGDGTMTAAKKIANEVLNRNLKISIVGIPKTIDNDIYLVSKSFGFDTAVDVSTQAIRAAHNEAEGYPNGIGLIKLMGRHSGFIAATATLAQQDVNFVLIPEVDFDIDGNNGLLACLEKRLNSRHHAVILVAEGAGQKFFGDKKEKDTSGNIKLHDIGGFLKDKIDKYFQEKNIKISLKYIDPSYMIRSLPANSNDHVFCNFLGRNAVHAAMSGKTNLLIGFWNNFFVHVPLEQSAGKRKQVDPQGELWNGVLASTGQSLLKN